MEFGVNPFHHVGGIPEAFRKKPSLRCTPQDQGEWKILEVSPSRVKELESEVFFCNSQGASLRLEQVLPGLREAGETTGQGKE